MATNPLSKIHYIVSKLNDFEFYSLCADCGKEIKFMCSAKAEKLNLNELALKVFVKGECLSCRYRNYKLLVFSIDRLYFDEASDNWIYDDIKARILSYFLIGGN